MFLKEREEGGPVAYIGNLETKLCTYCMFKHGPWVCARFITSLSHFLQYQYEDNQNSGNLRRSDTNNSKQTEIFLNTNYPAFGFYSGRWEGIPYYRITMRKLEENGLESIIFPNFDHFKACTKFSTQQVFLMYLFFRLCCRWASNP